MRLTIFAAMFAFLLLETPAFAGEHDGDGIVGILDFGQFSAAYLTNDEEKIHRDGAVAGGTAGLLDFGFLGRSYLSVPGPSGTTIGTVACPW